MNSGSVHSRFEKGVCEPTLITPEMDRHNGSIFFISYLLIFLAAPVIYVGVIQAALCDKLGASATIANLPGAAFFLGNFAPILLTSLIPHRLERSVIVWANLTTATLLAIMCLTLLMPLPNSARSGALILQGLIQGFTSSTCEIHRAASNGTRSVFTATGSLCAKVWRGAGSL